MPSYDLSSSYFEHLDLNTHVQAYQLGLAKYYFMFGLLDKKSTLFKLSFLVEVVLGIELL